jgi:sugar/nucleoside kinase (ribokinase family)
MPKLSFLTIGGATQDITFHSPEGVLIDNKKDPTKQKLLGFEFGAKINISDVNFSFGGGAANTAISLARLGNKVSVFTAVGQDLTGRAIVSNLKKEKVNVKNVSLSELASGLSFIVAHKSPAGEDHVLFTFRGANEDLKIDARAWEQIKPDWVYLASLSGKNWLTVLTKIFALRQKSESYLAWNPGNLQLRAGLAKLKSYLALTDVLILNKDEVIELLVPQLKGVANPRKLLLLLKNYCPGILVITDGINGAYALRDQEIFFQPVVTIKKKDTIGVGDAFGSTFVWALNHFNKDINLALQAAMINSASVVSAPGAQAGLLSQKELLAEM